MSRAIRPETAEGKGLLTLFRTSAMALSRGWLILALIFLFKPSETQPLHFLNAISSFLCETTVATEANALLPPHLAPHTPAEATVCINYIECYICMSVSATTTKCLCPLWFMMGTLHLTASGLINGGRAFGR